ncbi:hypothetical protein N7478_010185 [Penicillium angulare]|uniref:uncharacterized protein n=1 Tax=Penicillium angulare TaxID=116970 RepID=UPI002540807A|nr:uncharacterized protein N7478_010185 [Penicillium angulare]KAJ5267377.1 hypothetical protein N7478_010185 [Penicillium angulare]
MRPKACGARPLGWLAGRTFGELVELVSSIFNFNELPEDKGKRTRDAIQGKTVNSPISCPRMKPDV